MLIYLIHSVLSNEPKINVHSWLPLSIPTALRFIRLNVHWTFTLRDHSFILIFLFKNARYINIDPIFKEKTKNKIVDPRTYIYLCLVTNLHNTANNKTSFQNKFKFNRNSTDTEGIEKIRYKIKIGGIYKDDSYFTDIIVYQS